MKTLIALLIFSLQMNAQSKIVDDLGWMIGKWQGEASNTQPGNKQTEFSQQEHIRWGAGQTVLVVDGIGTDPKNQEVLFHATGLLYYSAESESYKLHSFTKDNRSIVADFKMLGDKKAEWSFSVPTGTIIYKIDAEDGVWKENGYFQPKDSDAMYPFFEMKLNKI